ncbi:hypothetical protein [Rubripirellula reticaptiva]|nr:hypothetical protein [Rubripirellula reticaptiva]
MAIATLLLQVASTLAMVGLIWFVQVVHYPLFSRVGQSEFKRYETDHQRLTTWVVMPLMLTEIATAVLLIWYRPMGVGSIAIWLGIGLVAAIWLITFTVQVPQHAILTASFDAETHRKLVTGNWLRTVLWTVRGVLVLWMVCPKT